jgi:hypothetical protein
MLSRSKCITALYSILGIGVVLAFVGHGVLGAKGEEKFVGLVTGTYDKILGGSMSNDAATTIVNVIGVVDIALAVIFLGLVAAVIMRKGVAYSPLAIGLFGWAALWGFATALSRFTAELNGKEIWDVVERGPNFLLPAGLVYLIYKVRQEGLAQARSASANAGARPSAKPALTPST